MSLGGRWSHKYEESHLKEGDTVHVYGGEVSSEDSEWGSEHRVAASKEGLYHITAGDEGIAVGKKLKKGLGLLVFGALFGIAGLGVLFAGVTNLV